MFCIKSLCADTMYIHVLIFLNFTFILFSSGEGNFRTCSLVDKKYPDQSFDATSNLFEEIQTNLDTSFEALANPNIFPPDYNLVYEEEFDFIIIGAGSAGSVLANRLSEIAKWKILLIEAGGDPTKSTEIPGLFAMCAKTSVDWQYETDSEGDNCLGMVNNSCKWPRGKCLGGSSSINGNLYVRGNYRDYDGWANAGNPGWNYKDVLPYFKKSEDIQAQEVLNSPESLKFHGIGGYLKVNTFNNSQTDGIKKGFSKGMKELGYDTRPDINIPSPKGVFPLQGTLFKERRWSTAKAFLSPIKSRENLKVSKHSLVTKILIDSVTKSAYAVELLKNNTLITVKASKEVILSAGAINSPHVLMLSGIGPKHHLEKFGIKVIQDLQVGKNLQDHLLMLGTPITLNYSLNPKPIQDELYEYLVYSTGSLTNVGMLSYVATVDTTSSDYPDFQLHQFDFAVNDTAKLSTTLDLFGLKEDIRKFYFDLNRNNYLYWMVPMLSRPKSSGEILLQSSDPKMYPKIISNYLTDEEDIKSFLRIIKFIYNLTKTDGMKELNAELRPVPICSEYNDVSDEYWICALKHLVSTTYHPSSTCKMGPESDPNAVVNSELKVIGINNLRVVDASIMPAVTSGNTNAPTIMIGEKASDLIKAEWIKLIELN